MKRISNRMIFLIVLMAVLALGTVLFLGSYLLNADDWVVFSGSPHVYMGTNLSSGVVTDRGGNLLLDSTDGRTYSADEALRKATLHLLGDRYGYISAPVLGDYADELVGFDLVNGLYSLADVTNQATLTIDATVQKTAQAALSGRKGTIGVYNYKTGELLCAVTSPTYDPDNVPDISGDTSGAYEGVYLNRFTQSTYVPGSIFKIVTTAAALETVEGVEDMTFTCYGAYDLAGGRVTCEAAHGTQTLAKALTNSCNCAFAQIAQLVGGENMTAYVEKFGITQSVSLDGITTAAGHYDVAEAAPGELAWSCIGQHTDLINPCAYLTFLGAIANDGQGAQPYVVDSVTVGSGTTYQAKTTLGQRIMSRELAQTLQQMLRNNVVEKYGADNFAGLTVCAKSGTSQLGGGLTSNAMFAGFCTDEEYPLAFLAVVEQGGYGASTCIPILSQVLAACKSAMDGAK